MSTHSEAPIFRRWILLSAAVGAVGAAGLSLLTSGPTGRGEYARADVVQVESFVASHAVAPAPRTYPEPVPPPAVENTAPEQDHPATF